MPTAGELIPFIEHYFVTWGIWLVPVGAFFENSVILGFIFPGVTVILLSGFVARTTGEGLYLIIALATLGSFLGDNFDYFIGRKSGAYLENKPLFAKPISVVEPYLRKYGIWAVFIGRFSGWSRAWVAMGCGVIKFPYWKFAIVSLLSAALWTSAWIIGGYLLGGNKELIQEYLNKASILAWLVFVLVLVYYFRTRIKLILDLTYFASKKYGRKLKIKK